MREVYECRLCNKQCLSIYLQEQNVNLMIFENLPWCSSTGRRLRTVSLENLT